MPKRKRTSEVWEHFTPNHDQTSADCVHCAKNYKIKGGCTSGLGRHLITHGIFINGDERNLPSKPSPESSDDMICQLVAVDGIPFSVVAKSSPITKMFSNYTKQAMPASPNTIRDIILRCYAEKKTAVINQIAALRVDGRKLTITLDEWTSGANRRYMNINLHTTLGKFWNLGLARIEGSFTAVACLELVKEKLAEFSVNLEEDIFAIATDGAATMKSFGRLSGKKHLLCMAHGIHLAVTAVLYKRKEQAYCDEKESEDEEEDDMESIDNPINEIPGEETELVANLGDVISKVRRTVKIFRTSAAKTESLKNYSDCGISLMLDTRTRWNSLLAMLERVHRVKDAIQKAFIDHSLLPILTDWDFGIVEDIIHILRPVKVAVECLCRRDTSLITADVAINFMMGKLAQNHSDLGKNMFQELKTRILERRTVLSEVASYLHYGNDNESLGHTLGYFSKTSRQVLINNLKSLHEAFAKDTPVCETFANESTEMSESLLEVEISLESELNVAISRAVSYKLPEPPKTARSSRDSSGAVLTTIKKEMGILESVGRRGTILQGILDMLMTIPPSTVEAERTFSSANNFCRKVRTRLGDSSMNALVFLKEFYRNN